MNENHDPDFDPNNILGGDKELIKIVKKFVAIIEKDPSFKEFILRTAIMLREERLSHKDEPH